MSRCGPIAIWGAGGHACVVEDCARLLGYSIAVCVETGASTGREPVATAVPVIRAAVPAEAAAMLRSMGIAQVALGFGHCEGRLRVGEAVIAGDLELVTLVHPSASVSPRAQMGRGVFVGAGAVTDPRVVIGDFVIVNDRSVVCHDSTIGRASHICPGAVISGGCTLGERCWVGAGAVLRDHIHLGDRVFLGCGSVVTKSLPEAVLAYGNPAQVRRAIAEAF